MFWTRGRTVASPWNLTPDRSGRSLRNVTARSEKVGDFIVQETSQFWYEPLAVLKMRVHCATKIIFGLCSVTFEVQRLFLQRGSRGTVKFKLLGPNEDFVSPVLTGLTGTDIEKKYALVAMGLSVTVATG